MLKKHLQI